MRPSIGWMEAGTVLLRDDGIRVDPGWREILAGIAVHQSADLAWAAGFLWLGIGKLTRSRQTALLAAAVPWPVLTAAIEYYLILPWLQPILRRQVPFWTAVTVHICSASLRDCQM